MTARQRLVLAMMRPETWHTCGELAEAADVEYRVALRCLWLLNDSGHVVSEGMTRYRLTQKGAEPARRERERLAQNPPARRQRKAPKPKAAPKPKPAPKAKRKPRKPLRKQSFTERYKDPEGPRYGQLFLLVRVMRCWLDQVGYSGRGHHQCGMGVQGGHTAHHVGRLDAEGLIPGCGAAHDLYAGLGGAGMQKEFRAWLAAQGFTLPQVGAWYVGHAQGIAAKEETLDDKDLQW